MNIFFGKFSTKYPEQIEKRFYGAGSEGNPWYGGVEIGDYIIPIYSGRVFELWQAEGYGKIPNKVNSEGVLKFQKIQDIEEIAVSTEFLRNRNFVLDLNTLNKSVKSVKCGFIKITLENPEVDISQLILNQKRNLYIAQEESIETLAFNEMDIRVLVDSKDDYRIISIQIYKNNKFETYSPLWKLYLERNKENERYNLQELLSYAKKDNASKKLSYLIAVIDDLKDKGWFKAVSPVALYDNVLVGRKRSASKKVLDKGEDIESVTEDSLEDDLLDVYEPYRKLLEQNPNLILYGPPGTGKTYTAQKIIEYIEKERNGSFLPFEKIIDDDRVKFITFHQSYSYEEFVEGIRPDFEDDTDDTAGSKLQYKITDGIIKEIANRANLSQLTKSGDNTNLTEITKNSRIYKISLGQRNQDAKIYNDCRKNNHISIGWLENDDLKGWDWQTIYNKLQEESEGDEKPKNDANTINLFVNEMNIGDIVLVYDGPATIRDIVLVTGDYTYVKATPDYHHRRSVNWLQHFDEPKDIIDLNGGVRLTMKTIYPLNRIQFADIKDMLSNDEMEINDTADMSPCYLIIDEINRGNISKIFGELITLIEKDKRDKLRITLPYSRKPFKLPSNIYIIGTMNTADRSIAILDTALRRRFTFVEIEPDPQVIKISDSGIIEDDIDLSKLLEKLNDSIQKKYDRDHRIGHSYFMELDNYSKFYNCWYYKIIPLLMDYFYNDLKSISWIIGKSFVNIDDGKINRLAKKEFLSSIKKIYES